MSTATRTTPLPQPGDLYVSIDEQGNWNEQLTFDRFYNGRRDLGLFLDSEGLEVLMPFADVRRPGVVTEDDARTQSKRPHKDGPLTDAQRRMIFGLARSRGIDRDTLRDMTPNGSISQLTRSEAIELIDWLGGDTQGGGATVRQQTYIRKLAGDAGMDDKGLTTWLLHQADVRTPGMLTRDAASRAIHALKRICRQRGIDDP